MSEILIHKGSTKDVYQLADKLLFKFSDRYSVFDWGEMPDHLHGKGKALADFTFALYKKLEERGIPHHLFSDSHEEGQLIVKPFTVLRNTQGKSTLENTFIPLEVIFRMGVAQGSSLLKRYKTPDDWLKAGFPRAYSENEMFKEPVVEFTTKLERFDRPLTHDEARELSGLDDIEWNELLSVTKKLALALSSIFSSHGLTLWDGKAEFGAGLKVGDHRQIILVDSIGPDELRLTKDKTQLSKEVIRQYYKKTEWFQGLEEAKETFGIAFKEHYSAPPKLPEEFKSLVENMYVGLSEVIKGSPHGEKKLQEVVSVLGERI